MGRSYNVLDQRQPHQPVACLMSMHGALHGTSNLPSFDWQDAAVTGWDVSSAAGGHEQHCPPGSASVGCPRAEAMGTVISTSRQRANNGAASCMHIGPTRRGQSRLQDISLVGPALRGGLSIAPLATCIPARLPSKHRAFGALQMSYVSSLPSGRQVC